MHLVKIIFWTLIITFVFILAEFFIPAVRDIFMGSELFLVPLIIFSLLGIVLIVLTFKKKIKGRLKTFFLLTGISSAGFFISVFLHNAFYALAVITSQIIILKYLMGSFSVLFFFVAIIVCPLVFLIGAIGGILAFFK